MNEEDRYIRQQDLVPAARLRECRISVVGVGSVGRQIALQLAFMGARRLQLIDHDIVEAVNLPVQGFLPEDLGMAKVEATAGMCRRIDPQIDVETVNGRFRRSMETGDVLFCAVDSIGARRLIWQGAGARTRFFADARVAAETVRVVTACDTAGREHYPQTLFAPEEAFAGSCTAKMTLYLASLAASLCISQFCKFLRHRPVEGDLCLNVAAMELSQL